MTEKVRIKFPGVGQRYVTVRPQFPWEHKIRMWIAIRLAWLASKIAGVEWAD